MIDPKKYRDSVGDYETNWCVLDEELYGVCQRHPGHDGFAGVAAKVYIVGLSYSTQIERHVPADGTQGGSLMKVISLLHRNAVAVDALLAELKNLAEPLTCEALTAIASIHGRLVNLLCGITRNRMRTPSFASKYLHFHHPVIPIYDNVAAGVVPGVVHWDRSLPVFDMPPDADKDYAWYLLRFFRLYQEIAAAGLPLKVKYVDNYLLSLAWAKETPGDGIAAMEAEGVTPAT